MDKNFTPEVMPETPFPGEPEVATLSSQANPAGTFSPNTAKEKTFPKKRTAVELLSTALNTRSKKILQSFEFTPSGAIQIGDFKQGISGDLRLTPNGLTARDIAGLTTFAIDGDTGDAVFAGELRSGSVVTGSVIVTNGNIALYNGGILEIFIGDDGT